jgi:hypothetical protein
MHAIVRAADIQDRDGGALVMASLFGAFPFLVKLYADAPRRRNRQTIGSDQRLGRPAQALDRRTKLGLAWPLPKIGQGLGMPQPQGACLLAPPPIRLMLRKLCNRKGCSRTDGLGVLQVFAWLRKARSKSRRVGRIRRKSPTRLQLQFRNRNRQRRSAARASAPWAEPHSIQLEALPLS